jgi:putative holliday junction resolvase
VGRSVSLLGTDYPEMGRKARIGAGLAVLGRLKSGVGRVKVRHDLVSRCAWASYRRSCVMLLSDGIRGGGAYNRGVSLEEGKSDRPAGRVLGLDVGSRRIGIAVSDPLGITAQGLETLQRRNKRHDLAALERVIRGYEVREIVVGLPLRMSGAEGTQSEKMQVFAEELRKRFRLPVHLWDERLTSAEANRLLRETELSIEKRAKAVDRMAAVLILQGWMERRLPPSGSRLPAQEER